MGLTESVVWPMRGQCVVVRWATLGVHPIVIPSVPFTRTVPMIELVSITDVRTLVLEPVDSMLIVGSSIMSPTATVSSKFPYFKVEQLLFILELTQIWI